MQNYSKIQKFLHDMVLSKKFINKSLYEIEKIIFLKDKQIKNENHLFITGLPRSGTTSLLNFIYSSNKYASLTFKNMPFLLSPHFSKFFNKQNIKRKQRIHNDGISYDINSPEALDEIFFNNDVEFVKTELVYYIQLILNSVNKNKYLSKNNLNFNRIDLINSILPNSKFLIPIREPLQHAYSLLNQHLHFCKLQKKDVFIRRYMNYLGHFEFGISHKSWKSPLNYNNFNKIDYWLEQWFLVYQNIFEKYQSYKNCQFIIYEKLNDLNYLGSMIEKIGLKNENLNLDYFKNSNKSEINIIFNESNYNKAKLLYKNFLHLKFH